MSWIFKGNTKISKIFKWNTPIKKVYKGNTLVWSSEILKNFDIDDRYTDGWGDRYNPNPWNVSVSGWYWRGSGAYETIWSWWEWAKPWAFIEVWLNIHNNWQSYYFFDFSSFINFYNLWNFYGWIAYFHPYWGWTHRFFHSVNENSMDNYLYWWQDYSEAWLFKIRAEFISSNIIRWIFTAPNWVSYTSNDITLAWVPSQLWVRCWFPSWSYDNMRVDYIKYST